jgi:hypothetical protein
MRLRVSSALLFASVLAGCLASDQTQLSARLVRPTLEPLLERHDALLEGRLDPATLDPLDRQAMLAISADLRATVAHAAAAEAAEVGR